jgi:anti-sigma B factor antagonist
MSQVLDSQWFTVDHNHTLTFNLTHLDYRHTNQLKQDLLAAFDQDNPEVLLDMRNVDFIDSTGLGLLLFFKRYCDGRNGRVALTGLKPYVSNLVCITNLQKAIPVYQSAPQAPQTF